MDLLREFFRGGRIYDNLLYDNYWPRPLQCASSSRFWVLEQSRENSIANTVEFLFIWSIMLGLHSLSKTTFDSEHMSAHEIVCTSSCWWNSQPSSTALSLLDCQVGLVGLDLKEIETKPSNSEAMGIWEEGTYRVRIRFYENGQIKMILWHSFEEGKCEQTPNQGELRASLPSWVGTGNDQDWQRTPTWRWVLLLPPNRGQYIRNAWKALWMANRLLGDGSKGMCSR